jgi:hypothetical protein
VGLLLPTSHAWFVYGITAKVTSDGLVARLVQWGETIRERFAHMTTLVIKLENGPENHSRRTLGGAALLVGLYYFTSQMLRTTQEGQITDRFTKGH